MTEVKSAFLYNHPTQHKRNLVSRTQKEYTRMVNWFIERMAFDETFFLDILNNNNQSPLVRQLEKDSRRLHKLGSAYGQNTIDMALKELHNHFTRIKNRLYGFILSNQPELEPYISFKSLLNVSLTNQSNEKEIIESLLSKEKSKSKPDIKQMDSYTKVLNYLCSLSENERLNHREDVAALFLDKLHHWKLPLVKQATIQLDTRLCTFEKSHSTKEDCVVSVKLLGSSKRVSFPVSTSKNSLRRLNQYKAGSLTLTLKNNKVCFSVPFSKKITKMKENRKNILSGDVGIIDLIYTNAGNRYGSFQGMVAQYEQLVENKLGRRSSLRNLMRKYQRELKKSTDTTRSEWLRMKISNIANMLNQQKTLKKARRRYNHMVNVQLSEATRQFVHEAIEKKAIVVLEDLDIAEFDRGKKSNKRDSSWARGKLIKKITEKLHWNGIRSILVEPAYTSQMCSVCSNIHEDNRQGKVFVCTVCNHTADADHNAALNIQNRGFDKEISEIVEKYRYATKKRHKALKNLLLSRHCSYLAAQTSV